MTREQPSGPRDPGFAASPAWPWSAGDQDRWFRTMPFGPTDARYRAALEAGTDPGLVGGWIAEVQAQRLVIEQELRKLGGEERMTAANWKLWWRAWEVSLTSFARLTPLIKRESTRILASRLPTTPSAGQQRWSHDSENRVYVTRVGEGI
ncbi:MAG: hypothetical protein ACRDJF_02805 [Actinomycetota bacterium]